jgi:hypothetical protein
VDLAETWALKRFELLANLNATRLPDLPRTKDVPSYALALAGGAKPAQAPAQTTQLATECNIEVGESERFVRVAAISTSSAMLSTIVARRSVSS